MKSLPPSPANRSTVTLEPGQPVHTLVIARGQAVQLTAALGCTWLTCDGALQDWFLSAGGQLTLPGPARLRLGSAHLHARAQVHWDTRPLQRHRHQWLQR